MVLGLIKVEHLEVVALKVYIQNPLCQMFSAATAGAKLLQLAEKRRSTNSPEVS